jgi:hypothetical protein
MLKKIGITFAVLFGLVIVLGMIAPAPPTTTDKNSPANNQNPKQDVKLIESQTKIVGYYKAVMNPLSLCETAAKVAFGNFERVTKGEMTSFSAYEAVSRSRQACEEAEGKIATIEKPTDLPNDVQNMFDQYSSSCFGATRARTEGMTILLKILDGDLKPSVVNELTEKAKEVEGNNLRCATALGGAAGALGVKSEALK